MKVRVVAALFAVLFATTLFSLVINTWVLPLVGIRLVVWWHYALAVVIIAAICYGPSYAAVERLGFPARRMNPTPRVLQPKETADVYYQEMTRRPGW